MSVQMKCLVSGCDFTADYTQEPLRQWNDVSEHLDNTHREKAGITRMQIWWAEIESLVAVILETEDETTRERFKAMARGYAMCLAHMLPQARNNMWTADRIGAHVLNVYKARKAGESIPPTPGVNGGMRIETGSIENKDKLKANAASITKALNSGLEAADLAKIYKTTPDQIEKVVMEWTNSSHA